MLLKAITLDTAMTASEVLARLARHGFWIDPMRPESRAWIEQFAQRVELAFTEAERRLARNDYGVGLALRRQYRANVLWYAQTLDRVLHECHTANPAAPLLDVLNLHEHDGQPPIDLPPDGSTPGREGVVFLGETPVGVSMMLAMAAPPHELRSSVSAGGRDRRTAPADSRPRGATRGNGGVMPGAPAVPPPKVVRAWPRIDAPEYVAARQPFTVIVGLAGSQQAGVAGGQIQIAAPAGVTTVNVSVELISDGLDAPAGWTRTLAIEVEDPTAATVGFVLVGRDPAGSEPYRLTTLEIRYVLEGTVCGTASRALVIGRPGATAPPTAAAFGTPWLAQAPTASPVVLQEDRLPADLTIEIAKPNGNPGNGQFQCRLYSPHPLAASAGPFAIDLGQDAKTFAKSIVQQIRDYHGDPLVDNLLRSLSQLVGDHLPPEAITALREVAALVAPRAPAVLLVSADPYVPWELASIEPPIDPARPSFLGAQVALGRWIRDAGPSATAAVGSEGGPRPPAQPPATIQVAHMAVMAGMYRAEAGLRRLPEAEAEATKLVQSYDAIALAATSQDVKRLLDAELTHKFQVVGGAEAIHFAGHGDFDPQVSDGSVLMLSEGRALPSIMFRSAKYGGKRQPLFFLNACMIGIGGELLGDMGGFPGNCLKGGFGGILGALWEVDDTVAHDFALAFWQRALPVGAGAAAGQSVGEILRDLRAQYAADTTKPPIDTYVAYVYYGHPRLTLQAA